MGATIGSMEDGSGVEDIVLTELVNSAWTVLLFDELKDYWLAQKVIQFAIDCENPMVLELCMRNPEYALLLADVIARVQRDRKDTNEYLWANGFIRVVISEEIIKVAAAVAINEVRAVVGGLVEAIVVGKF